MLIENPEPVKKKMAALKKQPSLLFILKVKWKVPYFALYAE
jgi:hypothetical protein